MAGAVWVFHRGALGDSVLLWPVLRALMREHADVVLVTDGEKARLAAEEVGVTGVDAEQRRFNALWVPGGGEERVEGVARVIGFVGSGLGAGLTWVAGARRMFPGAAVEVVTGRVNRREPAHLAREVTPGRVWGDDGGPMVLHVGAGSGAKRWALGNFVELARRGRARGSGGAGGRAVEVIAGEVEAERFSAEERAMFLAAGGVFVGTLAALAERVKGASVVVGNDSGAAHLAAQLGVRTVALFGPTDPEVWGPVGPRARSVGPGRAMGMGWLGVEAVERVVWEELERG